MFFPAHLWIAVTNKYITPHHNLTMYSSPTPREREVKESVDTYLPHTIRVSSQSPQRRRVEQSSDGGSAHVSAGVPVRAHAAEPPLFTPAGRTTRPLCVWVGDRERKRKKFGTMFTFLSVWKRCAWMLPGFLN